MNDFVQIESGAYLGAAREFIKWNAKNGDQLTWCSSDKVEGLTVADIERMAMKIAIADRTERGDANE